MGGKRKAATGKPVPPAASTPSVNQHKKSEQLGEEVTPAYTLQDLADESAATGKGHLQLTVSLPGVSGMYMCCL